MLLQGKRLLITGVLTPQSLAYGIAELAQQEGAEIILTSFGRGMSLTERSAKRLDPVPQVLELDVTNAEHFARLTQTLKAAGKPIHGVLHAVAYAPEDALGGNFLNTPWESVSTAFRVSTFSLKELAVAVAPVMTEGGSIVALDFDNSTQAWPVYDWMGVCKAAMISLIRYLAGERGGFWAAHHHRREGDPRVQAALRHLDPVRAARLERARPPPDGREDGRGAPVGLVPGNHRRGGARGWWAACHRLAARGRHGADDRRCSGRRAWPEGVSGLVSDEEGSDSAPRQRDAPGPAQGRLAIRAQNRFSATMSLLVGST